MHQILISCREAAIAAVLLFPIFWIWNQYYIHDKYRSLIYLVFSIYLSTMYAAAGLPDITYFRFHPHFNFKPFLYMFSAMETTVLNVVLFIPLGFFMPLLWHKYRSFIRTMMLGFSVTLFIELMQIFTYRATDINDLITNSFGTLLGYLMGKLMLTIFPVIRPSENHKDILLIFGTSFSVMFFLYPFLTKMILM